MQNLCPNYDKEQNKINYIQLRSSIYIEKNCIKRKIVAAIEDFFFFALKQLNSIKNKIMWWMISYRNLTNTQNKFLKTGNP